MQNKIYSQDSATLIIHYKSEDYTKKSNGVFKYDFETIKYNPKIFAKNFSKIIAEDLYTYNNPISFEFRKSKSRTCITIPDDFEKIKKKEGFKTFL